MHISFSHHGQLTLAVLSDTVTAPLQFLHLYLLHSIQKVIHFLYLALSQLCSEIRTKYLKITNIFGVHSMPCHSRFSFVPSYKNLEIARCKLYKIALHLLSASLASIFLLTSFPCSLSSYSIACPSLFLLYLFSFLPISSHYYITQALFMLLNCKMFVLLLKQKKQELETALD